MNNKDNNKDNVSMAYKDNVSVAQITSDIYKKMDTIKMNNIKAIQHAWIDGANSVIIAKRKGILTQDYFF